MPRTSQRPPGPHLRDQRQFCHHHWHGNEWKCGRTVRRTALRRYRLDGEHSRFRREKQPHTGLRRQRHLPAQDRLPWESVLRPHRSPSGRGWQPLCRGRQGEPHPKVGRKRHRPRHYRYLGFRRRLRREPRQMAFGPTGRIYAVERNNNRVSVFERNGTFVRSFGSNLDKPEGVTVSPQGEVYVADTNNHRIQVFDLNGSFRRVFGEQGDIDGRFDRPMGLGFNASGELLVADFGNARIQAVDANGSFLWKSNHNINSGLRSLNLSRDGLILLGGRDRLRILDNRGNLIHQMERQRGQTFNLHDGENFSPVAFAPDGSYRYFNGNDELRHYKRASTVRYARFPPRKWPCPRSYPLPSDPAPTTWTSHTAYTT